MTHKHIFVEERGGNAVLHINSYPSMRRRFALEEWLVSRRPIMLVLIDYVLWFGIGYMVAKMV